MQRLDWGSDTPHDGQQAAVLPCCPHTILLESIRHEHRGHWFLVTVLYVC